jgi:serine/threonine protein kinase
MIVGSSPFYYDDIDQMELFESIVNDPVNPPDTISSEASNLILRLLAKDPMQRLGTEKLLEIVEHPWFADLDLAAMRHKEVTAPWVPDVQGPTDTSYFDDWSDLEQENDVADGNQNGDMSKKGQILSKRDQKLFEGVF